MKLTSFNLTAIKRLENYLDIKSSDQLTPDTLSEKIEKKLNPQNNYNPFNNYDLEIEIIKGEIRTLIKRVEEKYNTEWERERKNNRRGNQGYVAVGTKSPLPNIMEEFKNRNGKIPDNTLPGALDMVAETLHRRRTSNFNAYDESGFDIALRKSPEATKSLLSNGLNYLVKYPIMAGLGGIAFGVTVGAIATEGASRLILLSVSGLAYGALKIAERLESTSLSRGVFGSSEFEIQGAIDSVRKFISSTFKDPLYHTSNAVDAVASYLSGDAKQEKTPQQKTATPATTGRTSSVERSDSSIYYNAHASGDKRQLQAAEDARFEREKEFQERQNAKRKKMEEEAKQKAKKPQQTLRASSFPSQNASQIQKSLFGPDGRLQRASTMQSSPLSRPNSQQPPRERGGANRRPSSDPVQPLAARQGSSRGTGNGAPPPPRHR